MSQGPVRYVEPNFLLTEDDKLRYSSARRQRDMIPVIPLTALREVVEGLKLLSQQQPQRSHPLWGEWVNGQDYRTKSFKQWLAQRLLASLGEQQ